MNLYWSDNCLVSGNTWDTLCPTFAASTNPWCMARRRRARNAAVPLPFWHWGKCCTRLRFLRLNLSLNLPSSTHYIYLGSLFGLMSFLCFLLFLLFLVAPLHSFHYSNPQIHLLHLVGLRCFTSLDRGISNYYQLPCSRALLHTSDSNVSSQAWLPWSIGRSDKNPEPWDASLSFYPLRLVTRQIASSLIRHDSWAWNSSRQWTCLWLHPWHLARIDSSRP